MRTRGLLLATLLLLPVAASARVGGGHSYSGSRSSGSSSRSGSSSGSSHSSWSGSGSTSYAFGSGSSTVIVSGPMSLSDVFCTLLVVGLIILFFGSAILRYLRQGPLYGPSEAHEQEHMPPAGPSIAERMRALDESFSEPVFLEWATLLYVRAQSARGGDVEALEPFFKDPATQLGRTLGAYTVSGVRGVVVGSQRLVDLRHQGDSDALTVLFQACLTVTVEGTEQSLYQHERWVFRRAKGVQSRTPDTVERAGCPSCGAPFERSSLGRCESCGTSLVPGASDWCVAAVSIARQETRPPLLVGTVAEEGTDLPTRFDPGLEAGLAALEAAGFDRARFLERAKHIFFALQEGWTSQRWDALRPYETEAVFQSHRFWMEEYTKQGLRNVLTDVRLLGVEFVKAGADAAYETITCRMHAAMRDSTVNLATGELVGGNPKSDRFFTEYWTFLRRPGAKGAADDARCPNCGAPLKVTQAGLCEYCQASITRGQFDWVLSRIEQDEDYTG